MSNFSSAYKELSEKQKWSFEKFLSIKNNGVSMKYALNYIGVELPKHLSLFNYYYDSGK